MLVGCGPRGREHAEALREVAGLELRAVCDLDPERRERAAADFGVPGLADLEEGLDTAPAIVVLATAPSGRAALAQRAAAAGARALLVEKPMALRMDEGRALVETCERAGTLLAVGHQLRHARELERVRELVAQGAVGEVEFVRGACFGNLLDQGPHLLDAMRWLQDGSPVRWAMAQRGDAATAGLSADALAPESAAHPAPSWVACHLAFDSGVRGALEAGGLYQRGPATVDDWLGQRLVVVGTEGMAECRVAHGWRVVSADGRPTRQGRTGVEDYRAATRALHADLRDALREDRRPRTDGRDALATLEGILACAQSVVDGDAVVLPLEPERDPLSELAGREPAPRRPAGPARPAVAESPDVSVVFALPDHRGLAPACISSWVTGQTLPGAGFEVVVVADGAEPELELEIERRLRPGDRLLRRPPGHEIALYDAGVRAARGRWVLMTEPHCLAEPRCLEELLRMLEGSEYDGACLRSTGMPGNAVARMEERFFEEGFREWSRDGHWCKVVLRGFAVRRDAYEQVGGFQVGFRRFAEFLLAAQLHAAGKRIGYAPGASVRHLYTESLAELSPPVRDFAGGEAAFLMERGDDPLARYFDRPPELSEASSLDRRAGAAMALSALRALPRAPDGAAARAFALTAARGALTAVAGPAPRLAAERARFHAAEARCALLRPFPARLYPAFMDAYAQMVRLGRLEELASRPPRAEPRTPVTRIAFAEMPDTRLLGFHPVERAGDAEFRWTRAVARAALPLAAGEWELSLDSGGLRSDADPAAWLDGRRLRATWDGRRLRARVRIRERRGDHELAVSCAPWRQWRQGSADRRELGLPLVALELTRPAGLEPA